MIGARDLWYRIVPKKIIIYADFIDPFCYIGFHNLEGVANELNIPWEWRGFELNPDTPEDGFALETAANSDLRNGMWASVFDFSRQAGLSFPQPERVPNTRMAQELVELAGKYDVKKPLIERIYQAYFNRKQDIGNLEVLIPLAIESGLPEKSCRAVLKQTAGHTVLENYREEAKRWNFPGMPGFIFGRKPYFGALSKETWRNILKK